MTTNTRLFYVGSYTNRSTEAISLLSFNPTNGEIQKITSFKGMEHASFMAIDNDNMVLYAVSETIEIDGKQTGKVVSYKIDENSGHLKYINERLTEGGAPCHLSISSERDRLHVVNYMGGNIALFPINDNGEIGEMSDLVHHQGRSVRDDRQEGPHPHSINIEPMSGHVHIPDLGLDKVLTYKIDNHTFQFVGEMRTEAGSGPRHLTFHPSKPILYVINELDCTITVCENNGALRPIQTVQTLQRKPSIEETCADIHITPSGQFLYASTRGNDTISAYKVNEDGRLSLIEIKSTYGKTPRNFTISPDGRFLLVGNQDSDTLIVFEINAETGELSEPVSQVEISEPVCIKFLD